MTDDFNNVAASDLVARLRASEDILSCTVEAADRIERLEDALRKIEAHEWISEDGNLMYHTQVIAEMKRWAEDALSDRKDS